MKEALSTTMTIFGYRFGIRLFTLLGLLSVLAFVFGLDPGSLSHWGMVFFFVSLWVVACGIFSLFLLYLYEKRLGSESALFFLGAIFRQALLLGTWIVLIISLFYLELFAWWVAILSFVFFVLLELTIRRFSPRHA